MGLGGGVSLSIGVEFGEGAVQIFFRILSLKDYISEHFNALLS